MPYTKQDRSVGNILCYQISGVITDADYTENLIPETNKIIAEYGDVRMLCDIVDFRATDMTWTAMWEDTKFGFQKSKFITRFALICKHNTLAKTMKAFFIGTEFKTFSPNEKNEAYEWIFAGTDHESPKSVDITNVRQREFVDIPFFHTTKFLVAIGEGAACNIATGHALNLLKGDGSTEELHFVTVLRSGRPEEEKSKLSSLLENAVTAVEGSLGPRSLEARTTMRVSGHLLEIEKSQSIAQAIVELAGSLKIDYIIMGTEHATQDKVSALFHRSVALEVLDGAPCPVIMVQLHQEAKV